MRDRHTQRIIKQIIICFVLGVIATIAVAWGCALFIDFPPNAQTSRTQITHGDPFPLWYIYLEKKLGAAHVSAWALEEPRNYAIAIGLEDNGAFGELRSSPPLEKVPSWTVINYTATPPSNSKRLAIYIDEARGWPMLSLCWTHQISTGAQTTLLSGLEISHPSVADKSTSRSRAERPLVLPLRPIWPNFAYCTLFYTAIAWLLFFGPGVLRRWMRRRNNRCPRCGYDLRGHESSNCPECGEQKCAYTSKENY